jgi:phosphohistidine phosphatase SixA
MPLGYFSIPIMQIMRLICLAANYTYINAGGFGMELRLMRLAFILVFSFILALPAAATEVALAKLLEGGHTILMRHAIAPGTGDPANFKLDDCSTQRNLSDDGRQQARRIGARLAARAIKIDIILSSQWCRAQETARLAFPRAKIILEPALNSFFADPSSKDEQTAAITKLIGAFQGSGNQLMVTHQVNIMALTGIAPRDGEAVIVDADRNGAITVVGRQLFD